MTSLTLDGAQAGEGGRPPSRPLLGVTAPGVPPRCSLDRQAVLEIWGGEEGGDTGVSRAPSPPPKPNCPPPQSPPPCTLGHADVVGGPSGPSEGGSPSFGGRGGPGGSPQHQAELPLQHLQLPPRHRRLPLPQRLGLAPLRPRRPRHRLLPAPQLLGGGTGSGRGGDGTRTQTNREQHWDRVRLPLQGLGGALGGPKESESGPGGVAGCPGGVPGDQRGSRGGPRCSRGAPEDLSVSRGAPRGS